MNYLTSKEKQKFADTLAESNFTLTELTKALEPYGVEQKYAIIALRKKLGKGKELEPEPTFFGLLKSKFKIGGKK